MINPSLILILYSFRFFAYSFALKSSAGNLLISSECDSNQSNRREPDRYGILKREKY